jgi:hypothetical protein
MGMLAKAKSVGWFTYISMLLRKKSRNGRTGLEATILKNESDPESIIGN